jgi:hypothetical protein
MAMGPGMVGQLITNESGMDMCNDCHAPLAEQRPTVGGEEFQPELRAAGLSCASCHVRDGEVHGPPRREGNPAPTPDFPHGGFTEHVEFEDSNFCGSCHQFRENQRRVAGVLLEDTYNEWSTSDYAARGETCQSCHMPDRRHLWRGIHDPAFTEAGLDIRLTANGKRGASYTVKNTGVGHKFPTYVTPRVTLTIQAIDENGEVQAQDAHIIQRRVTLSLSEQPFDTRLGPGEEAIVSLDWKRSQRITTVKAQLLVEPDEFYQRFYEVYRTDNTEAAALIQQAHADTQTNIYVIGKRTLTP